MKYLLSILILSLSSPIYSQDDFTKSYGTLYPYEYLTESKLVAFDSIQSLKQIEAIQKSVVRINNSFTGSFVSSEGLLLTVNHAIQDQHFDKNILRGGFYSYSRTDELKTNNLEIFQLHNATDITDNFDSLIAKYGDRKIAVDQIKHAYRQKKDWSELRLEIKDIFNSNQVVLHGYKVYDDIRLVFLPPADNRDGVSRKDFMDFAFFRVYENNIPINSTDFHLKTDLQGNDLNQNVYIVGYPQKTSRYRSLDELQFIKDHQEETKLEKKKTGLIRKTEEQQAFSHHPDSHEYHFQNEIKILEKEIEEHQGFISGLENSETIELLNRRQDFINTNSETSSYLFTELAAYLDELETIEPVVQRFSNSRGIWFYTFLERLNDYRMSIGLIDDPAILKGKLQHAYSAAPNLGSTHEQESFKKALIDLRDNELFATNYIELLEKYNSEDEFIEASFNNTAFISFKTAMKLLNDHERVERLDDPMLKIAEQIIPLVEEHSFTRKILYEKIDSVNHLITKEVLRISENKILSPDANGTLRISPGKIKNYNEKGIDLMKPSTLQEIMSNEDVPSIADSAFVNFIENHGNKISFIASDADGTKGSSGAPLINDFGNIMGLVIKSGSNSHFPKDYVFDSKARAVSIHIQVVYLIMRDLFKENEICEEMIGIE